MILALTTKGEGEEEGEVRGGGKGRVKENGGNPTVEVTMDLFLVSKWVRAVNCHS